MKKNAVKKLSSDWKRDFTNIFNESLEYIFKQKKYIYTVALIFLASGIIGFAFAGHFSFFDKIIKGIVAQTGDLDYLQLIWFIFSNNVTSSLFGLFLGLFFGIFPFFNALFNGSLLGYVYSKAVFKQNYFIIWRLLPHGIFELPAVFISLGLGALFGFRSFESYFSQYKKDNKKKLIGVLSIISLIIAAVLSYLSYVNGSEFIHFSFNFIFFTINPFVIMNAILVLPFIIIFFLRNKASIVIFKQIMKVFLTVIVPLLMAAAFIESTFIIFIG